MDSLAFDGYNSYSETSTPRTPSPTAALPHMYSKQEIDQNIFPQQDDDAVVVPTYPYAYNNNRAGSLLQELYEQDLPEPSPSYHNENNNWHHHQRQEFPMARRATFPYVRQDREEGMPMQQYPNFMQYSSYDDYSPHSQYTEFDESNIKLEEGAPLMVPSQQQQSFYRQHQLSHHHQQQQLHHHTYHHSPYPSPSLSGGAHPSYLSPHTGLPVQHTDDAASKETQYLRRRCFNCHTTEPPSWRRSTLNPGKIVCNKCGLYERTHLRPRPLRFDELRAGNKARKAGGGVAAGAVTKLSSSANTSPNPNVSPKQAKLIKKEPREYSASGAQGAIMRRSSVSSSASSVHSGSGASDWDDNVSLYSSSGSAPPTSYNSPIQHTYPLSRSDSMSPPSSLSQLQQHNSNEGGIRLPNNPLSDLMQQQQQYGSNNQLPTPRKSHTAPGAYFAANNGSGSVHASPAMSNKGLDSPAPEHASLGSAIVNASPVLVGSS